MDHVVPPVRFAGSTLIGRLHVCAFFNSPDEARRVLYPFIQEGLGLGEKVVYTIDPRQRRENIQWLKAEGVDLSDAERVEILDWTETHLRDGRFDQERTLEYWQYAAAAARQRGFPRVRFVSQMEWALEAKIDSNELLEYESKANHAWMNQQASVDPAVCVYDLTKFRGDIVVDVMRTHPLIIIGGVLQENPFFVPPEEFLREIRERGRGGVAFTAAA